MTESDKKYIADHYQHTSAPDIAKTLRKANKTVYDYLKAQGWTPWKPASKPHGHPFRRQNRKLETMFLNRQKENKGKPFLKP
jgi:hypothetical protein